MQLKIPYFFDQMLQLLFFSTARFCAAIIQGRRLFLRKRADINDGWIRYVHVVHCTYKWYSDNCTCTCNLPACCQLQKKVVQHEQPGSPWTVILAYSHTCACATYTSCSYYLRAAFILLRASIVRQLFKGGNHSRAVSNRRNTLHLYALICTVWLSSVHISSLQ